MATATVSVPSGSSSCLLPFQESFQDQLVCPFRLFSDHCLCTGFQSVWDSVCPLRAESISYSPPALPYARPASFQSQVFWELFFLVQDPWAAEPDVRLGSLPAWGQSLQLWLPSCLWVTHPEVWILAAGHHWPSYLTCCAFFFMSLVVLLVFGSFL